MLSNLATLTSDEWIIIFMTISPIIIVIIFVIIFLVIIFYPWKKSKQKKPIYPFYVSSLSDPSTLHLSAIQKPQEALRYSIAMILYREGKNYPKDYKTMKFNKLLNHFEGHFNTFELILLFLKKEFKIDIQDHEIMNLYHGQIQFTK